MAAPRVSSCEANCAYQQGGECTYDSDISINSGFECDFFEYDSSKDTDDAA